MNFAWKDKQMRLDTTIDIYDTTEFWVYQVQGFDYSKPTVDIVGIFIIPASSGPNRKQYTLFKLLNPYYKRRKRRISYLNVKFLIVF